MQGKLLFLIFLSPLTNPAPIAAECSCEDRVVGEGTGDLLGDPEGGIGGSVAVKPWKVEEEVRVTFNTDEEVIVAAVQHPSIPQDGSANNGS
jgi:hypothetical protein